MRIRLGTCSLTRDFSERSTPRKILPNAFTKHAEARALVKLNMARAIIRTHFKAIIDTFDVWKNAKNIINSLTNPFKGGSADIANDPIKKNIAV